LRERYAKCAEFVGGAERAGRRRQLLMANASDACVTRAGARP